MLTWESSRPGKSTKVHISSDNHFADISKLYPMNANRQTIPHLAPQKATARKPLFRMMFMECISPRLPAAPPSRRIWISQCIRRETSLHHHQKCHSRQLVFATSLRPALHRLPPLPKQPASPSSTPSRNFMFNRPTPRLSSLTRPTVRLPTRQQHPQICRSAQHPNPPIAKLSNASPAPPNSSATTKPPSPLN